MFKADITNNCCTNIWENSIRSDMIYKSTELTTNEKYIIQGAVERTTGIPRELLFGSPTMMYQVNMVNQVTDVTVYNDRVVKVTFADGSFTKAVCSENDIFDLDTGITVCLLKKVLGNESNDGTKVYNNLLRGIHNMMEQKEKAKEAERKAKIEAKEKRKKAKARKERRKQEARNDQIDTIAFAVQKALKKKEDGHHAEGCTPWR